MPRHPEQQTNPRLFYLTSTSYSPHDVSCVDAHFRHTCCPRLSPLLNSLRLRLRCSKPTSTLGDSENPISASMRLSLGAGRNDPCPCSSGKQYQRRGDGELSPVCRVTYL